MDSWIHEGGNLEDLKVSDIGVHWEIDWLAAGRNGAVSLREAEVVSLREAGVVSLREAGVVAFRGAGAAGEQSTPESPEHKASKSREKLSRVIFA